MRHPDFEGHIADEVRDASLAISGRVVSFEHSRQIAARIIEKINSITPNPPEPITWKPTDRFHITGRGTLMTGPYPFNDHPAFVIGRLLSIDGEIWSIVGTEQYVRSNPIRRGNPCGLLLKRAVSDV